MVCNKTSTSTYQKQQPMLVKLGPIFHTYARHKEERIEKALTRQQWIIADRIIMAIILFSVIVAAVAFS